MRIAKPQSDRNVTDSLSCVLRWVLRKGTSAVSCEINMAADRSFRLRVVPSWAPGAELVQCFANPLAVMERHAEVAGRLREAGWVVTERQAAPATLAA